MQFLVGVFLLSFFFIIFIIIGGFLLFRKSWLLPWLRANLGIACLFFGLSGVVALTLLTDMESVDGELDIAQASINTLGDSAVFLRIKNQRVGERDIELNQKDWRLRALQIQWSGPVKMMGIRDGVLLYDLQQSNGNGPADTIVIEHESVVKVWELGRTYLQALPFVHFNMLETQWHLVDRKTVYDVTVTSAGLVAKDRYLKAKSNTAQSLFEEQEPQQSQISNLSTVDETDKAEKMLKPSEKAAAKSQ